MGDGLWLEVSLFGKCIVIQVLYRLSSAWGTTVQLNIIKGHLITMTCT